MSIDIDTARKVAKLARIRVEEANLPALASQPVSYTHLDVYKRQTPSRGPFRRFPMSPDRRACNTATAAPVPVRQSAGRAP